MNNYVLKSFKIIYHLQTSIVVYLAPGDKTVQSHLEQLISWRPRFSYICNRHVPSHFIWRMLWFFYCQTWYPVACQTMDSYAHKCIWHGL